MGAGDRAGNGGKALVLLALMLISVVGEDDLVDCALPLPDQPGAGFEPTSCLGVDAALWRQGVGYLAQSACDPRVEATVGLLLDPKGQDGDHQFGPDRAGGFAKVLPPENQ